MGNMKLSNVQLIRQLRGEIDRLRHELGRWRKKVEHQQKMLEQQDRELNIFHGALEELGRDRAAFLISAAQRYGWPSQDEGWELAIDRYDISTVTKEYNVMGRVDPERDEYVFRVVKKQEDRFGKEKETATAVP